MAHADSPTLLEQLQATERFLRQLHVERDEILQAELVDAPAVLAAAQARRVPPNLYTAGLLRECMAVCHDLSERLGLTDTSIAYAARVQMTGGIVDPDTGEVINPSRTESTWVMRSGASEAAGNPETEQGE